MELVKQIGLSDIRRAAKSSLNSDLATLLGVLEFDRKVNGLATAVKTWHIPVSIQQNQGYPHGLERDHSGTV